MLASSTIESLWDWVVKDAVPIVQKGLYVAFAVTLAVAVLIGVGGWLADRRARASARYVEILPPASGGSLEAAAAFWRQVSGLVAPRRWGWRPWLVFEIRAHADALRLGVWVPGGVDAGQVARKAESAWHGAQTRVGTPPAPTEVEDDRAGDDAPGTGQDNGDVVGRLLRPERATGHLPLRVDGTEDQLRELFEQARALRHGEAFVVQISARPLRPREAEHLRERACRKAAGETWWSQFKTDSGMSGADLGRAVRETWYGTDPAARITDTATGADVAPRLPAQRTAAPTSTPSRGIGSRDPDQVREEQRVIRQRFRGLVWQVSVRVFGLGDLADRYTVSAVAGSFGAYTDAGSLRSGRLARAGHAVQRRPRGHGFAVSHDELAALAHLPYETGHPGLGTASTVARHARSDVRDSWDGS